MQYIGHKIYASLCVLACVHAAAECSIPKQKISTKQEASSYIENILTTNRLLPLPRACFQVLPNEKSLDDTKGFEYSIYEVHNKRCGGDPTTGHLYMTLKITPNGAVARYDDIEAEFRPLQCKSSDDEMAEAISSFKKKDYATALSIWTRLANADSDGAQLNIGLMYENGVGVSKNIKQALQWYLKSAEHGNAHAQSKIASIYEGEKGIPSDSGKALFWYKKAAENNDATGQLHIGYAYQNGYHTSFPKSLEKAEYYFSLSAKQHNQYAIAALAEIRKEIAKSKGMKIFGELLLEDYQKISIKIKGFYSDVAKPNCNTAPVMNNKLLCSKPEYINAAWFANRLHIGAYESATHKEMSHKSLSSYASQCKDDACIAKTLSEDLYQALNDAGYAYWLE